MNLRKVIVGLNSLGSLVFRTKIAQPITAQIKRDYQEKATAHQSDERLEGWSSGGEAEQRVRNIMYSLGKEKEKLVTCKHHNVHMKYNDRLIMRHWLVFSI